MASLHADWSAGNGASAVSPQAKKRRQWSKRDFGEAEEALVECRRACSRSAVARVS
jgi:hypothetical protein